jgi:hypothetical protein
MTNYIKNFTNPSWDHQTQECERIREKLKRAYIVDGVGRWTPKGNFLPMDIARFAQYLGYDIDLEKHEAEKDAHTAAFLEEYIENQKNRTPEQIAEERFELLAAFGPGETVVNVITGERTQT